jgi:hypothetical protein
MIISYHAQGRLGNNIFQYIAIKVIQKYVKELGIECSYEFMSKDEANKRRLNWFGEFQFQQLYSIISSFGEEKKTYLKPFLESNWFFDGFYQFDYHIKDNLSFIKGLFTEDNEERINDEYRVCDIVKGINKHLDTISFNTNDIVTHVRLDDFLNGGIVMDHKSISKLIDSVENKGDVYVVTDKLRKPFEIKYMKEFKDDIKYKLISNEDMFKDLAYLFKAPNLICNNSTFCWIAAIFGEHKQVYIPKNKGLNYPQQFEKIKESDIVYDWELFKTI